MDILNYIDKMQEMYGDNPSSTVPGPRNMFNERMQFDGGGSPLQRLRQEIVDSMRPYAPGDVTEDQLQLVVKDITLDMTPEQAQASAKNNFIKLFGMADGGRAGYNSGQLVQPNANGSRPGYAGNIGQKKVSKGVSESSKKINKNINKWATNWFNKNQKNYGVRDFEKMQNDFATEWSKELTENSKKYEGYGITKKTLKMSSSGLPIIKDGISIDGIKFVTRADRPGNNPDLAWERLFYKNKLKNKDFKTELKQYVEWATANKKKNPNLLDPNVKFGSAAQSKIGTLEYGKKFKGFNDDVIFFMGDVLNKKSLNPGGTITGVTDVFKKTLGKDADNYFKKFKGSWNIWVDNFKAVGKLAGLDDSMIDALLKKQASDTQKIMKLYNVKNLPLEFRVAQDHLFGLAEAKTLGDPKIAAQTLKNLVASTREQNRVFGQEGFSNKRVSLIKKFKNANLENKANIVNQLNTLAKEYVPGRLQYNVKKDGSLKITNLQPETTLKAKTEAYKKLTKTFPKKIQNLSDGPSLGSLDVGSMFRKLSPATRKLVGFGGGMILPEVLFYQVDKANRMSKGVTEQEAAAGALESGTLGAYTDKAYMKELKKVAESMNIDSSAFDSAYDLNVLIKSFEKNSKNVDAQIATALENQDKKTAEELTVNFNKYLARIKPEAERLRNDIEERVTGGSPLTMAMGRGNVTDEQYSKPFYNMQDVALEKLKKEKQKVFPKQSRQVDPSEGKYGKMFFDAFDSLTQGAKNLLQGRIIPFGPNRFRPLESDREREDRYLKDMSGQELYRYNKDFRDFTYGDPITEADLINLQMEQPGLFAGGGIAGLSGGDKSGPPPESGPMSQGLRSLYKNGRKL